MRTRSLAPNTRLGTKVGIASVLAAKVERWMNCLRVIVVFIGLKSEGWHIDFDSALLGRLVSANPNTGPVG